MHRDDSYTQPPLKSVLRFTFQIQRVVCWLCFVQLVLTRYVCLESKLSLVVCFSLWPCDKLVTCPGCNLPSLQDSWRRLQLQHHHDPQCRVSGDRTWMDGCDPVFFSPLYSFFCTLIIFCFI